MSITVLKRRALAGTAAAAVSVAALAAGLMTATAADARGGRPRACHREIDRWRAPSGGPRSEAEQVPQSEAYTSG